MYISIQNLKVEKLLSSLDVVASANQKKVGRQKAVIQKVRPPPQLRLYRVFTTTSTISHEELDVERHFAMR